jgi:hypothetical protein
VRPRERGREDREGKKEEGFGGVQEQGQGHEPGLGQGQYVRLCQSGDHKLVEDLLTLGRSLIGPTAL